MIGIVIASLLFLCLVSLIGNLVNQTAALRKMDGMQRSLDDLNQKLRDLQRNRE
ncbi:hypothetical protein IDH44_00420 [Paenibacillus sp. IB182496]|uniref:Uncharacterized protein n=1 Tax=Paenibacillus sabuli TaxID=2772509 RepID=A0A927BP23_9BACL|nr:hypothetical protein [Paenibacillus sabuli]MBD2843637.1 hypothetical protein [Paenibacillus sabuli]